MEARSISHITRALNRRLSRSIMISSTIIVPCTVYLIDLGRFESIDVEYKLCRLNAVKLGEDTNVEEASIKALKL